MDIIQGRGAQLNTNSRFEKLQQEWEIPEGERKTQYLEQESKSLVNKVDSPDVGMFYSMNPYQGCEHGCVYCYARNSHEYWGYSAGIDFESRIIVKKNATELLRKFLSRKGWECKPISISGNTDCYQPAEKKFKITRRLLEVSQEFNQPIGIITKNALVLRDKDILAAMAEKKLASVVITVTSLTEATRRVMEPRTTTAAQRLRTIRELSAAGVRTGVMIGPVVPGLTDHELPAILAAAAEAGASFSAYTFVRLNGAVKILFHDWLYKHFPERADKVWHGIEDGHGGQVNDNRFGTRMRGEGVVAELVRQQFKKFSQIYKLTGENWEHDCSLFATPAQQLKLF